MISSCKQSSPFPHFSICLVILLHVVFKQCHCHAGRTPVCEKTKYIRPGCFEGNTHYSNLLNISVYSYAQNDLSHLVTCWAKDILFSLSTPSLPLKEKLDLGFDACVLRSSIQSETVLTSTGNSPSSFMILGKCSSEVKGTNCINMYKLQTLVHMLDGSWQPAHTANEGNTPKAALPSKWIQNGLLSVQILSNGFQNVVQMLCKFFAFGDRPRFRGLHAPQRRTPPIPVATRRPEAWTAWTM